MTCKTCGGSMTGDGYTVVRHCENVDVIGEGYEPDANPLRCPPETLHLNHASHLPPVNCPLLIQVDGELLQAHRTVFVSSRADTLVYRLHNGREIEGRFPWTYP